MKKNVEDRLKSQNMCMGDLSVFFFYFLTEKYVQKSLNKTKPQSPKVK